MIADRNPSSETIKAPRERGLGKVATDQYLAPGHDLGTRAIATLVIAKVAEGVADIKAVGAGEAMTEEVEVDVEAEGAVGVVRTDQQRHQQLKRRNPPRCQHQRLQHLQVTKLDLPRFNFLISKMHGVERPCFLCEHSALLLWLVLMFYPNFLITNFRASQYRLACKMSEDREGFAGARRVSFYPYKKQLLVIFLARSLGLCVSVD